MGGLRRAFTLIELLIVVAIIAILAAIAVPNFLEAQTRAKTARVKADLRTMATALESYYVDANSYPLCHTFGIVIKQSTETDPVLERLSTPIAYLTSVLVVDPFKVQTRQSAASAQATLIAPKTKLTDADLVFKLNSYIYQAFGPRGRAQTSEDSFTYAYEKATGWVFNSVGPDGNYYNLGGILANDKASELPYTIGLIYDPTNGTVSYGSIFRGSSNHPGYGIQPKVGPTAFYAGGEGLFKAIEMQR